MFGDRLSGDFPQMTSAFAQGTALLGGPPHDPTAQQQP